MSKSSGDFFLDRKVDPRSFNVLDEGAHKVRLTTYKSLTSFQNWDGSLKDSLPDWANPVRQLGIQVMDAKGAGFTHRLNGEGFVRFGELSEKDKASGKYVDKGGYACIVDGDGDLVRLVDQDRTEACSNILGQFEGAIGAKEGETLKEALDRAIAEKTQFTVVISNQEWEGTDQYRITSFRPYNGDNNAEVDAEVDAALNELEA